MKIKVYRKLPVSEIYPCNSRDIKELKFEQLHSFSVSFGLNPEYSLDRFDKKYKFPTIRGQVIAYANIMGSDRYKNILNDSSFNTALTECSLYIYPIKVIDYPENAMNELIEIVLPNINSWFNEQIKFFDTARLVDQKLIVEWFKDKHLFHPIVQK